jgi:hypothetical protein
VSDMPKYADLVTSRPEPFAVLDEVLPLVGRSVTIVDARGGLVATMTGTDALQNGRALVAALTAVWRSDRDLSDVAEEMKDLEGRVEQANEEKDEAEEAAREAAEDVKRADERRDDAILELRELATAPDTVTADQLRTQARAGLERISKKAPTELWSEQLKQFYGTEANHG